MKKFMAMCMSMCMTVGAVTGCGSSSGNSVEPANVEVSESDNDEEEIEKPVIIATIFPIYDWAKNILGDDIDKVELVLLADSGVDLHSFQPSTNDIISIYESDMFIYVGGDSDGWVDDVMKNVDTAEMNNINLVEVLGEAVKMEVSVEGMQAGGHDHDHDEEDHDDHDHDHDEEEHDDHDHDEEEDRKSVV